MHRYVFLSSLVTVLLLPPSAKAFIATDALGLSTTVSGSSGIDPQNPLVAGALTISPSYRITQNLRLGLGMRISKDLTDDEVNDERHETIYSDITATLSHNALARLGSWAKLGGQARAYLPASEASRLMGRLGAVRLGGQLEVPAGPLQFTSRAYIQKYFHEYTTAELESCGPRRNCNLGVQLTSWSSVWAFDVSYALPGGVTLDASYSLINGHGYDNNEDTTLADVGVLGGADGELVASHPGDDGRHERFAQVAGVSLSYPLLPGVSASASIGNTLPQRRANGRDVYNPFIGYQNFGNATVVGFSLTHSL